MSDFHKPIVQANEKFSWVQGDVDPAESSQVARETAWALLSRVRAAKDPLLVERVIRIAETEGIEDLAQLWSHAHPGSLPGSLWRLYLLREVILKQKELTTLIYNLGLGESQTIDGMVAGVSAPVTPESLKILIDEILRGVFAGDFGDAMDRAAAAATIFSVGATALADSSEAADSGEATRLTRQALRFDEISRQLRGNAKLWRSGIFE